MFCAKFGWNWPSGSGEDENLKSLQSDGQQAIRKAHPSFQLRWAKKKSVTKLIVPCNETGKSSKLSEVLLLTMALALSSNKGGTLQTIGTHVMECSLKTKSLSETIKE